MFHKISFNMIGFLVLAAFGFASIQAANYQRQNLLAISIKPEGQYAVRLGQNVTILCQGLVPLQSCRFTIPSEGSLLLKEGQASDEGIEYAGSGRTTGDCGVHIRSVQEKHDGEVTCSLTPEGGSRESSATVKLVVARAPYDPQLYLSPGMTSNSRVYKAGERMTANCVVEGGKPAATISLYLDDELLTIDSRLPNYRQQDSHDGDPNRAEKNYTHVVSEEDNGKRIRCVAEHISLERPLEVSQEIEVYYGPVEQGTIEQFGFKIGQKGVVNVTISANPRPAFQWNINGERIYEGDSDNSNRLQSYNAVNVGKGLWRVILEIDSVQKSDTEKTYELQADNNIGSQKYSIVLSTASEPAGVELDAGSIIGIVIGVMLLILAVFIAVFARATGRWCFAAIRRGEEDEVGDGIGGNSEVHITTSDNNDNDDNNHINTQHIINDEKIPYHGGQENPILHNTSSEYINGKNLHQDSKQNNDIKKIDTPV